MMLPCWWSLLVKYVILHIIQKMRVETKKHIEHTHTVLLSRLFLSISVCAPFIELAR